MEMKIYPVCARCSIVMNPNAFDDVAPGFLIGGECGIANFTARISDLRQQGVALDVETVKQENRYGETVRFARYRRKE